VDGDTIADVEWATTAPAASTTASTTTTTTTTAPPEEVRTLAFGGDLLTHLPLVAGAQRYGAAAGVPYDFGPMLAPMTPVLSSVDLALCHLEVPLVGDGQQISGYPSFHAPRELATAIAGAGYDGCSTASNHSLDGGRPAIDATIATFDALGLGHVGTARSPEEDVAPRLYDLDGVAVAHLSYAYGFNGYEPPADAPWIVDRIDPAVIARDAAAARVAGADLVVVSLHWGTEYQHEPDAFQRETAAAVTAIADVDLVIGHHAHVVQPVEQVGGTWVVFGLGNQLSNQADDAKRDGLTVVVTVAGPAGGPMAVRSIEAVPTFVDLGSYEVLPTAATLARPDLDPALRAQLEASQYRTMATVGSAGAQIPLRPVA
jgi:poly-gamma-glutamate synthesis protein (capsule biosynthesis protein)